MAIALMLLAIVNQSGEIVYRAVVIASLSVTIDVQFATIAVL